MEEEAPKAEETSQAIPSPKSDLENIKNFIQNSEKSKIVELICKLTNEQRQNLKQMYLSSYGTELEKDLKSALSGDAEDLILGLMKTPIDFDAEQIYLSMKGLGTDEDTLSEMIATRPSRRLIRIRERYHELYNETLENDIKGDTSDYYRNILIAMIQGGRSDNPYPNSQKMKEIVQKLTEDNDSIKDNFVSYFVNCSYGEICTICREYEKATGKYILDSIKNLFSSDEYNFFSILLNYISDPGKFFAEKIHGFKDKDLIRIIVSRSEENMDEIRDSYKELYNIELIEDIKNHTKGDFQLGLSILVQK
jgi:annexin A7/11